MRVWSVAVGLMLVAGSAGAQEKLPMWQPSAGHRQVEIWPGAAPDQQPVPGAEYSEIVDGKDMVAGKTWVGVENVSRPTMVVYWPGKGVKNTGAAVLVFPGGGYQMLAIDLEGSEACEWLNSRGITCVLLKYRVPAVRGTPHWGAYPQSSMALDDAQRTMGLVRMHAKEWGIDPGKIGVMGFSAGGHLVAAMSVHWAQRLYAPVDAADKVSCRPDFAIAIYPGHLSWSDDRLELNPDIKAHLSKDDPPTFLLQNEDDHVDTVKDSLAYYMGLLSVGVPVELHSYAQGGHAFGLRETKLPATHWTKLVDTWLGTIGMVEK